MRSCTLRLALVSLVLVFLAGPWVARAQTGQTAAVAVFPVANCVGSATFRAITASSYGASVNGCQQWGPNTEAFGINCASRTYGGRTMWELLLEQRMYHCSGGNPAVRTVGVVGDTGCYNIGDGSMVLDCSSSAASKINTTLLGPVPMTTNTLIITSIPSTPDPSTYVSAAWEDTQCQTGSGVGQALQATFCRVYINSNSSLPRPSYRVSCAAFTSSSSWTVSLWAVPQGSTDFWAARSLCQSGAAPTQVITGSDTGCVTLPLLNGMSNSVVIDCSANGNQAFLNYVPAQQAAAAVSSSTGFPSGPPATIAASSTGASGSTPATQTSTGASSSTAKGISSASSRSSVALTWLGALSFAGLYAAAAIGL